MQKITELCFIIVLFFGACFGACNLEESLLLPGRAAAAAVRDVTLTDWNRDELYRPLALSDKKEGAKLAFCDTARKWVQYSLIDPIKSRDDIRNRNKDKLEQSIRALAVITECGKTNFSDCQDRDIFPLIEAELSILKGLFDQEDEVPCWKKMFKLW